ncbi:unnamed protein product [Cylindrotheca closterium]|uniref:Uncharacterized protein n=1 Tax=Cylindrotheca closterium TaxID=2856 RepID=A0AAD2CQX9_9STRA|nr:unnamed protein product [Cylindrotheca closterium]
MKPVASDSYYSRDQTSYSESTRTPYIQEDDSMMTYYTDESVERRQNKKLTYDTFIPMESDSSRESASGRGWRKEGLSIDTRNDVPSDDEVAEEAAKKTLSPGMVDTENIRNKRRQRLARMARTRNERQEAEEDEENYHRRNYESNTATPSSPIKQRYVPSPIVEERPERSFSVSPQKYSRYGSTQKGYDESAAELSTQHVASPTKRGYSGVLSPQGRSSPQKASGAFQPYKSPANMTSSDYARTSYNFDFRDDDNDNGDESDVSRAGSSNDSRASSKHQEREHQEDRYQSHLRYESDTLEEQNQEDRYQSHQRYETDTLEEQYGDDSHGRYQYQDNGDSSTLNAKPSDGSDIVPYSSSPKKHHERGDQLEQDEDEHGFHALTKSDSDGLVEHRDGYERHHDSARREELRDEARKDYESTPYRASNHKGYRQDHQHERSNVSSSNARDRRTHGQDTYNENQIDTYQINAGNGKPTTTPTAGRHHPSQNLERRRYAPEPPSQRESIQAHMAHAYVSPHGYQNPEYAAMANHNARHALLRRYGANHNANMHPPMPQQYGQQQLSSVQASTPKQLTPMHPPMPQQYQIRTQTTRKVAMPVMEDDSARSSGRRMSPMIEDHSYMSMESSFINASVNTGVGCQAIQCQSVMTKIWTCGTIGDVDDFDPRTKIFAGLAEGPMGAFAMGAQGPRRNAVNSKSDRNKKSSADGKQNEKSFQNGFVGAIEKISAEAQFLGTEATQLLSGVINGPTQAGDVSKEQPAVVKSSKDDDSSSSSDSSDSETEFDIGGPSEQKEQKQEKKKEQKQEKKPAGGRSKQQPTNAQIPETALDVTGPKSPSNGIYASVVKGMNRRDQLMRLQKERQTQNEATSTKQGTAIEFATGTDQLRDVYKHLFDTMKSPMNPLYLENPLQAKKDKSLAIEEVGTKGAGLDGETVFLSFDKDPESKSDLVSGSQPVAVKEEKVKEEKEKAAVSGILSALENTLAQMMLPDSLSQANVEDSVIGSIGGDEETKSAADEHDLLFIEENLDKKTDQATPNLETSDGPVLKATPNTDTEAAEAKLDQDSEENSVSKEMMNDLNDLLQKKQEQKPIERYEVKAAVSMVSMTDADIEAELERMTDDESMDESSDDQIPDNYDGPTDDEIMAELMGGMDDGDDGEEHVKSMFDDATVDDDQSALSLPSVLKSKTRFSNEVSQLKIISEDTTGDLESLKRAAKALEEAINRASTAHQVQRTNATSAHYEVTPSMSSPNLSFTTALMEETQEPSSSWLRTMWKK